MHTRERMKWNFCQLKIKDEKENTQQKMKLIKAKVAHASTSIDGQTEINIQLFVEFLSIYAGLTYDCKTNVYLPL